MIDRSAISTFLTRVLALSVLAILGAARPSQAVLPVSPTGYSLVYPDGWDLFSASSSSNGVFVSRTGRSAVVLTYTEQDAHPYTAVEALESSIRLGITDSTLVTAKGSKTIGNYVFSYTEVREHPTSDQLSRMYTAIQGNTVFTAGMTYDESKGAGLVAEVESALATLRFDEVAAIHQIARRASGALRPAQHDVLGRLRGAAAQVRLFRISSL